MQNKSFISNLLNGIRKRYQSAVSNPWKEVNINWFSLKYYKHLSGEKLRQHTMFGKTLYFFSAPEFLHGMKEIFLEKIYQQQLPPKPYIIDCGANIGLSVIYMKQLYPDAEILAFEPDEKNFELLSKNIASFQYNYVNIRKEAVWIDNTFLHFSNAGSMSSKIETQGASNTYQVKAVRLKDFLNRKVDFLKIDIEGAEYQVLCDLGDALLQVNNLFVEYHGTFSQNEELSKLFMLFTEKGFRYYIKEADTIYTTPFTKQRIPGTSFDVQLNIFCFRG
jgi:FkbM family methyltransferase